MRVFFLLFNCLFILTACGLNANQEKTLNSAVVKYLFAVNSDLKLSRASYTHPSVLKYYKSKGNDQFKNYFLKEEMIWTDFVIGRIESKENYVHVELKIALKKDEYSEPVKKRNSIFAISDDSGSTWFFVENEDYNLTSGVNFKRLIK